MKSKSTNNEDIRIVILDRGWVFVGVLSDISESERRIDHGYNIRTWGTQAGLGELALYGPLPNTILDPVPTVFYSRNSEVATIVCSPEKWKHAIKP